MIREIWKDIPGFPGYQVSDLGRVHSYRSPNGKGEFVTTPNLIKQTKAKGKKYYRVHLSVNGKHYHKNVHILVLTTFRGPRPSTKHDACHDDGNEENNTLLNLYWGTKKENAADRIRHGTQCRGEKIGVSVLSTSQVEEILEHLPKWKKGDGNMFAVKFGVSDSTISQIKLGKTWNHL